MKHAKATQSEFPSDAFQSGEGGVNTHQRLRSPNATRIQVPGLLHVICVWVSAMLEHRRFGITGQVLWKTHLGSRGGWRNMNQPFSCKQHSTGCLTYVLSRVSRGFMDDIQEEGAFERRGCPELKM